MMMTMTGVKSRQAISDSGVTGTAATPNTPAAKPANQKIKGTEMSDKEIMRQALEALEIEQGAHAYLQLGKAEHIEEAITALRERLSRCDRCGKRLGLGGGIHTCSPQQPEQEHVIDCPRCGHCCPQQPEQEPVTPKCGAIIEVFGKDWRLDYLSLPVGKHKLYTQQYTYAAPQPCPVPHSIVAGALFDCMGWLTTRSKRLVLSSTDDAAPAAEAIKEFAEMRGLRINDAQVQEWQQHIVAPQPAQQPLTEEEIFSVCAPLGFAQLSVVEVARAIEAAHGITGEKQ